jgi:hypothetical protein
MFSPFILSAPGMAAACSEDIDLLDCSQALNNRFLTIVSNQAMAYTYAMAITEYLRALVNNCGQSRYAICKSAKIDQAALKRFAEGGDIAGKTLDKLWSHFGLPVPPKPRKRKNVDRA